MSPPWTCRFQLQRVQTSDMTGALLRPKDSALRYESPQLMRWPRSTSKEINFREPSSKATYSLQSVCRRIEFGHLFSCRSDPNFIRKSGEWSRYATSVPTNAVVVFEIRRSPSFRKRRFPKHLGKRWPTRQE